MKRYLMTNKKKKQKDVETKQTERDTRDEPIDPYTGEVEPPAEGPTR